MNVLLTVVFLLALTGVFYTFFAYCYRVGMGRSSLASCF